MSDDKFSDVVSMVHNLVDKCQPRCKPDDSLSGTVKEILDSRNIIRQLLIMRVIRDLSQSDIALKMGCSQDRISAIEDSVDSQLKYGELCRYAEAVGCRLVLKLVENDR